MRYVVGIDLGSTTTKAVILDADAVDPIVLGRGITNGETTSTSELLIGRSERIRRRDAQDVVDGLFRTVLREVGIDACIDIGALHARAILIDDRAKGPRRNNFPVSGACRRV